MSKPKVIFLDAVGTIFGVRKSVGEVYSAIAQQEGVEVPPEALNQAFYQTFKAAPPCAFPGISLTELTDWEYDWWREIVYATLAKGGVINQFPDFDAFFGRLYQHFATPKPWYVYQDVIPALVHWQEQGIELGIISNFDSRLYSVLEGLKLKEYFDSITISSLVGAAKPDPQIFTSALEKHQCSPEEVWHIGDSLQEDYSGAIAVGIKAFLIERN
ncbi:HAD family hydrolase [Gloeocapsa sp. PCC 73106]|uniref:HAD-IA family hydrolase n=1 Tax=Gloeocapsa sp. PCC 73106 TaxID=102232 RepID=UPI0002AC7602|nr:HAD family hydrolase [Gloeocapsa sp. PCC 73106]ELR98347.1 haloacid dehalogenase superfamily enzyme, subfamily IA,REG-2-like HAD hydrolase, subfamily IA [Gloeocapsa sp. PCC 73106]